MTDDLVKMARLAQRDDRMATGALYGDLADRIEALVKERDTWRIDAKRNHDTAEAAEAALVNSEAVLKEAVELLESWTDPADRPRYIDYFLAKHGSQK